MACTLSEFSISVQIFFLVKTRCLGFYQKNTLRGEDVLFLRKSKAELVLTNLKNFGLLSVIIIKNKML